MTWLEQTRDILDSYIKEAQDHRPGALLKALVEHAPTRDGQRDICRSILKCEEKATDNEGLNEALCQLSHYYEMGLILPMKAQGGKTPKISEHPSRQESMEKGSMLDELYLSEAKRDQRKLKNLTLRRDNYRSVLSGVVDITSARNGLVAYSEDTETAKTQAAHILPFSLATNLPEQAQLRTILSTFSGEDMALQLGGENINRLGNVLTLTPGEHSIFCSLEGWLEEVVGQPNTYIIRSAIQAKEFPRETTVTFTTCEHGLELPDPRFIAIHAACAKVIHQCGMAEHLDRILRDWEDMTVLAADGSGSDALLFALQSVVVQ